HRSSAEWVSYRCIPKNSARTRSVFACSIARLRLHRDVDLAFGGEIDRSRVAGVGVTEHAHSGIAGKNALESALGIFGAVGDDDHAGVLRVTDADAAAVVD